MVSFWFRILFFLVLAGGAPLSHAVSKETTAILLFGDSIVAGYGLRAEDTVPSRLQAILREEKKRSVLVINGGVSGDTTAAGRGRLAWALEKHKPDLVILALGGNDVLRGIPPESTRENIEAMLNLLTQKGIATLLSAVRAPDSMGGAYQKQFDSIYTQAAKRHGIPLYPFLLSKTFGKAELMQPDGIHPNEQGARLIANDLAHYLETSPGLLPE